VVAWWHPQVAYTCKVWGATQQHYFFCSAVPPACCMLHDATLGMNEGLHGVFKRLRRKPPRLACRSRVREVAGVRMNATRNLRVLQCPLQLLLLLLAGWCCKSCHRL
jgi:hypothetical protein